jgi:FkbM family methyltransferase
MRSIKLYNRDTEFTFTVDDYIVEKDIIDGNFPEHWLLDAITDKYRISGGTWVDVGASFGTHSVFFSKFCADRVVSFEPIPYSFNLLGRNIFQNSCTNILAHNVAIGRVRGKATYTPRDRWLWVSLEEYAEGEINIYPLDDFPLENVKVIKIDVEGMELDVLCGAEGTIAKYKPELFIEAWDYKYRDQLLDFLKPYGYKIIERYNHAPTYFFSVNDYKVTYRE